MSTPSQHILSCPAPRRVWERLPSGKWFSRPWTAADVAEAKLGGAWFAGPDLHDFADTRASMATRGTSPGRKRAPAVFNGKLDLKLERLFQESVKLIGV